MTKKTILLATLILLSTGIASAQTQVDSESIGTGLIGPESIFYPVQLGFDTVMNTPAENAVKRANEAREAADRGNFEAADRALNHVSQQADRTEGSEMDKAYLSEAQLVINEIEANHHAEEGLDTASQMINEARNRNSISNGEERGGFLGNLASQARESTADVRGNRP